MHEVLVTGSTGFAGRPLTAALRCAGYLVHEFSSRTGDIARHPFDFPHVIRHVYHLAARTFVPASWKEPAAFYETNVLGTINALEFCRRTGASITVVSSYVYGQPEFLPIREDHRVRAFNPYSHSKILAEQAAEYYASAFGIAVTIVRPFNMYGPGQPEQFLIPTLIRQALDPGVGQIEVADDRPRRDYVHVQDVVALLLSLRSAGALGTFNAGSGISTSIRELADIICDAAGTHKPLRSRGESRPEEVLDVVADISRARALGWTPRISLRDGIRSMIAGLVSSGAGS
jgi:nucleoside-diphosphate-sugar epimerase